MTKIKNKLSKGNFKDEEFFFKNWNQGLLYSMV